MTDRPILFSAPMIRALFDGRKTMARVICQPVKGTTLGDIEWTDGPHGREGRLPRDKLTTKYSVGDRLWVRETFAEIGPGHVGHGRTIYKRMARYRATEEDTVVIGGWTPSVNMPRWASRLTLIVTAVKIERLQDISGEDAVAEGMASHGPNRPQDDFRALWNSIHGKGAWDQNPWVAAISFDVVEANIDEIGGGSDGGV